MTAGTDDRILQPASPFAGKEPDQRLAFVVDTMRELSRKTNPQAMVQFYGSRVRQVLQVDG